jgi:hypothetical protein
VAYGDDGCIRRRNRPAYREENPGDVAFSAKPFIDFNCMSERFRCLAATQRGTRKNAQTSWGARSYPFGNPARLPFAALGQAALHVRPIVFGLGVTP